MLRVTAKPLCEVFVVEKTSVVGGLASFPAVGSVALKYENPLCIVLDYGRKEIPTIYIHTPIIMLRRHFQHAHFIPIVGVGKRGEY